MQSVLGILRERRRRQRQGTGIRGDRGWGEGIDIEKEREHREERGWKQRGREAGERGRLRSRAWPSPACPEPG